MYQKGIIISNMYMLHNRTSKYIKEKLLESKEEIDNSTMIRAFNTPVSVIAKVNTQKILVEM